MPMGGSERKQRKINRHFIVAQVVIEFIITMKFSAQRLHTGHWVNINSSKNDHTRLKTDFIQ